MDPELQKQLAALLAKLMDVAQQGATWTADQIPPLIQEKITYGRIREPAYLVVWIVVCLCVWRALPNALALAHESPDLSAREVAGGISTAALAVLGVVGFIAALMQVDAVLQVWLAPRLYIVEWLSSLIKK